MAEPGGVFTFTLKITNTSVENVTITALTDTNALSQECKDLVGDVLTPGQSVTCTYPVTHTEAGSYDNTATVTVTDNEKNPATDTDKETVKVTDVLPTVDLDKSAKPSELAEPGGVFTFTLKITNTSVENVTITELTDTNALSQECKDLVGDVLTPGQSVTCTYPVTHTDAGSYDNTATVTVTDNEKNPATDTDKETVKVTDVLPIIDVDKVADPTAVPYTGGGVTFTFTVANKSVEAVTLTSLVDDKYGQLVGDDDCKVGTILAAAGATGDTCTFSIDRDVAGAPGTTHVNVFTAEAVDNEQNRATDSDDATVGFLSLIKSADPESGDAVEAGDTINYKIVATNMGEDPITNEHVVDTLPAGVTLDADSIDPEDGVYDATARTITWEFSLDGYDGETIPTKEFTYKVTVTAGPGTPVLANRAVWEERGLEWITTHPVKAITAAVTSFCVKDAPFYSLTITPQNGNLFSSQEATVEWFQADDQGNPILVDGKFVAAYNPDTKQPYVDTYTLTDGALSIPQILWKGAAVDADGNATVWPGWEQPSEGVWVQVDSGGVRPGMFAVVTVNPTTQTSVVYPPAAAPCANPPGVPGLDKTSTQPETDVLVAGDTIDYQIKVSNTGGSDVTGPVVDTLPTGFTADATTISDGGKISSADGVTIITWEVTLAAGASKTLTYSGTVDDDVIDGQVLLNTATFAGLEDTTTHTVEVPPVAPIEDEEVVDSEEDLADTGANGVGNLVGAALLAMLAGGLMVTFGRRRRHE